MASYTCGRTNITCGSSDAVGWSYGMQNMRLFGGITYMIAVEGLEDTVGEYELSMTESAALQSA